MKATAPIYAGQKAALTFSKMLAGVMRQKRMDCTMVSVCLQRRRSCRSHACTASYSSISGKRLRASLFKYAWIRHRGAEQVCCHCNFHKHYTDHKRSIHSN